MSVVPQQVADGVFLVETDLVNWVLLVDGTDVTLVDSGYPGQRALVEASLRSLGRSPSDLAAVLVTHAHVDHLGGAQGLRDDHGVDVFVSPEELAHARRESHHSATPADVARNVWRPGMVRWLARASRVGVTSKEGLRDPQPLPGTGGALDLPGRPVPVVTPGHTPGHTVLHLPEVGGLITGDALVTAHPVSRVRGPQLLPAFYDDDRARTVTALDRIASLPAETLLPGHGPVHHGPSDEAAANARERLSR